MAPPTAPVPERRPKKLEAHGDIRVDDWYWLADRDDPAVLEHLRAENDYTEAVLAPLSGLRAELLDEIVARIEETDLSVPVRKGPWWYYQRTEEGANYAVHCRRPVEDDDPPLGAGREGEVVLLDENALSSGHDFFAVGVLSVSPDHRWLAYGTDTTGAERYTLHIIDLEGDEIVAETVPDVYYGLSWANDNATVFYVRTDDAMRPFQLWRHRIGTEPSADTLVLEETDERFTLSTGRTKDGLFVVIALQSTLTSEVWTIPAGSPGDEPACLAPRREGIEYTADHHRGDGDEGWWVQLTNEDAVDFRLLAAADGDTGAGRWREILAHRPGTRLDDVDVFDRFVVLAERLEGEASLRIAPLDVGPDPFGDDLFERSWLLEPGEHPATTWEGANAESEARLVRYERTSLVTPRTVLDLDVATSKSVVRKRQPVLGGYAAKDYSTKRLWATAEDGTAVPLSIVHRRDLLGPDGVTLAAPAPTLLYGYGAYEHSVDPVFSSLRLSLLERGFVFAIAHVRGGGELGRRWYEDGKFAAKPHTFGDFIAAARHLVAEGFTTPAQLAGRGGSAGGLLIGAVANLAPELFAALVAEVPFVDALTTMLDTSLPLTVGEWEEWGDPASDPEIYAAMRAYAPYDNVRATDASGAPLRYPRLLVTAGLNDVRVGYWEPAKWVAKLRSANPENEVLLRTELGAGHGGPSGRYDAWKDEALVYAFLLDALGVVTTSA